MCFVRPRYVCRFYHLPFQSHFQFYLLIKGHSVCLPPRNTQRKPLHAISIDFFSHFPKIWHILGEPSQIACDPMENHGLYPMGEMTEELVNKLAYYR